MCAGGVGSVLPVDLEVPGNPPPPLAVLHGLLVATGRKPVTMSEPRLPKEIVIMASVTGASLLLFFVSCACGLLLSALVDRRRSGVVIGIAGALASLFIMLASASVLVTGRSFEASLWVLQGLGPLTLRLDMLSSVFLFTGGIVYFSASLFVRSFINDQCGDGYPAQRFGVMYFALMASVVLILAANDAPLFLISWECMSILCFLFINYEQLQPADTIGGIHHARHE